MKSSITEKRQNRAKYLMWYSIKLTFVNKTSMSNPVGSLGYIKCYSSSSPRPVVRCPSNSISYNCQWICSWLRRPKTLLEIRKKNIFKKVIKKAISYKFLKDFTNNRKKTARVVGFSSIHLPNILKYRGHQ